MKTLWVILWAVLTVLAVGAIYIAAHAAQPSGNDPCERAWELKLLLQYESYRGNFPAELRVRKKLMQDWRVAEEQCRAPTMGTKE